MKIPPPANTTAAAIYKHHADKADKQHRAHLGASIIGHECERYLWLTFRWAASPNFDGRMYRLFESGHREEARLLAELRAIGCKVSEGPEPGQQWRFTACDGHFGGSMDGAVLGIPEAPKTWHVFESKTHSAKSFASLQKSGVKEAFPKHYAQVQCYMHLSGMTRTLYVAVCKDTDEIYTERIEYHKEHAEALLERAQRVIKAAAPGPRLGDATHYVCKPCAFYELCHGTRAPEPNCRTCAHSTPASEGTWQCERWGKELDEASQRKGCGEHRPIPALLETWAELMTYDKNTNAVVWMNKLTKRPWSQPEYSSVELLAAEDKRVIGDTEIADLKQTFDAKVTWDDFPNDIPWDDKTRKPESVQHDALEKLYAD